MIYYDGDLGSIIESVYLREDLDEHLSVSGIVVNPANPQYIFCKTVVLNDPTYLHAHILSEHGCRVLSRIEGMEGTEYQPYIIRPDLMLQWNGEVLEFDEKKGYTEICKEVLEEHIRLGEDGRLYFPKILSSTIPLGSALSWALHQVGIQYFSGRYQDLDVLKTCKKGVL